MPAARHSSRSLGHRIGGHGDDVQVHRPATVRRIRRVASRPSSSGICTSISTTSYGCCSSASSASSAVPGDVGLMAETSEHGEGDGLVHRTVLDEEDRDRGLAGLAARGGRRRLLVVRELEHAAHDVVELGGLQRFGELGVEVRRGLTGSEPAQRRDQHEREVAPCAS